MIALAHPLAFWAGLVVLGLIVGAWFVVSWIRMARAGWDVIETPFAGVGVVASVVLTLFGTVGLVIAFFRWAAGSSVPG